MSNIVDEQKPPSVSDLDWSWYCQNETGVAMTLIAKTDGVSAKYVRDRVAKARAKVTIYRLRKECLELREALRDAKIEIGDLRHRLNGPPTR